ncbi:DNA polymerase IV [Paenimyroides aestuarii]|uniref:DNA polymerase IV n=1 Tax=Paenimyroides aestuarii TaxID=2968490 RepID=A0ABY5NU71_9FLAO|nr:DNA polymerase IV [Paenimyroides aestuarii]UUV22141.1 DNA polymerase IV [Paenimyroides aestuarii]
MTAAHRKIIHIDMDAFYASVEQLDFPELRNKPLAVGGSEIRGVISAASYEARKFGVRSAMSGKLAIKKCPELIFVKPRFDRYKEVSQQIRAIFLEYTDLVEPLSLDEAFLDVTINKKNLKSATNIAEEIRRKIFETTGLTASAGISVNKFLAKIASDYNKPNGQKTIRPEEIIPFLDALEIKRFFGVGKKTCEKMYHLGIFTGSDLRMKSIDFLEEHFGNSGLHFYQLARGISNSPVVPNRLPKSIGAERTFTENFTSIIPLQDKLKDVCEEVSIRLQKRNLSGKTLTLKIKYSDFTLQTKSTTLPYYISSYDLLLDTALDLLANSDLKTSVRLIGIQISNLNINQKKAEYVQLKFRF